jgi:hypothetical protein
MYLYYSFILHFYDDDGIFDKINCAILKTIIIHYFTIFKTKKKLKIKTKSSTQAKSLTT